MLPRREAPLATQALVIFFRFQSLNSDATPWLRPTEVLKRTGVSLSCQGKIIQRWRARGFIIRKTIRTGGPRKLNSEQETWVTSIETLQNMSHLSLERRAEIIRERFSLAQFSGRSLSRYYKRHKIRYARPDYRFWKSVAENRRLQEQQHAFVLQLGTIIKERAYDEIVYIDKTTVNVQMKASKCWLAPNMKLSMIKERGPSITVIGAISHERGLVHSEVFQENNNAELFQHFLLKLREKCAGRRVVIVMDNLRVHHAKILSDIYTEDFKELFLPPYSSVLNPIERLWSLFKRRWTQGLYHFSDELAQLSNKKQNVPLETIRRLKEILGKY